MALASSGKKMKKLRFFYGKRKKKRAALWANAARGVKAVFRGKQLSY